MVYLKFIFIFLLSSYSVYACSVEATGFDEICHIYTEAQNSSLTMSKEKLSDYIFTNIKNRVSLKDALSVYSAGLGLDPEKRYPIFKESAEYSLKHSWDCPAMKALLK